MQLSPGPKVGIDGLAVAVPRRYVDMTELAAARGVAPAKYTSGLGALEMAVAEPGEDTVALAAEAARRVLEATGTDPADLGLLVVGTETGVDHSKPVASFVHGLLDLPRTMRVYDAQHACYGGTAGLMAATEWVASGAADGRAALVICADIARYGVGTAGEPTQGAGAVAMLVRAEPAVLALDVGVTGTASTHVHDFWRPLGSREARVDGHFSMACYLDALTTAFGAWKARAIARGLIDAARPVPAQLARFCYHVPFCKMAQKAHVQLWRCERGAAWDAARDEAAALASWQAQVAPSLVANARIGNVYTGSLYLALLGLLDAQAADLVGERVGLFSYGSGCTSEMFSGVVQPGAAARIAGARLADVLAARERISVAAYEALMARTTPLPGAPSPGGFRLRGVVEERREYVRG